MSESKYTAYMPEIIKMQTEGKTATEIAESLNKKKPGFGATESAVRGAIKRFYDKENKEEQTNITKTLPENKEGTLREEAIPEKKKSFPKQEVVTVEKVEKLILNEVEKRIAVKEFNQIREKLNESYAIFSILNKELGEATAKLRQHSKDKTPYFLFGGIWLLSLLTTMISGYYIGHCFYKNTLLFGMNLIGIPGGMLIGLAIGFAIKVKKQEKRKECEQF